MELARFATTLPKELLGFAMTPQTSFQSRLQADSDKRALTSRCIYLFIVFSININASGCQPLQYVSMMCTQRGLHMCFLYFNTRNFGHSCRSSEMSVLQRCLWTPHTGMFWYNPSQNYTIQLYETLILSMVEKGWNWLHTKFHCLRASSLGGPPVWTWGKKSVVLAPSRMLRFLGHKMSAGKSGLCESRFLRAWYGTCRLRIVTKVGELWDDIV